MKPIDQTQFGSGHGNCMMACVASITGIPLNELPDVWVVCDDEWWVNIYNELLKFGWELVATTVKEAHGRYTIGYGPGPRGLKHSVVCRHGRIIHDPHPSREGLCEIEGHEMLLKVG